MTAYFAARTRMYQLLEAPRDNDLWAKGAAALISGLIALNTIAVVLESVEAIKIRGSVLFGAIEVASVAVFSVEFLLRVWCVVESPRYRHPVLGRVRYVLSLQALIDLIAVLPFYAPMLLPFDLRFLRALRMVRLLRILKLGRYSIALQTLGDVLRAKKAELMTTAFVAAIMMTLASSAMYLVESSAQPRVFDSIPAAMWWAVTALTTVGYGDSIPVTFLGKVLGAIVALLGIGLFALPAGVLGSGFVAEMQKRKVSSTPKCPHCGRGIPTSKTD